MPRPLGAYHGLDPSESDVLCAIAARMVGDVHQSPLGLISGAQEGRDLGMNHRSILALTDVPPPIRSPGGEVIPADPDGGAPGVINDDAADLGGRVRRSERHALGGLTMIHGAPFLRLHLIPGTAPGEARYIDSPQLGPNSTSTLNGTWVLTTFSMISAPNFASSGVMEPSISSWT